MSVSGGNRLADYCFEEEDYSLVDQVEDEDQEKEEEEKPQQQQQQEDHRDFHIVPSAFRDSDRNIHQHGVRLSNSSRKSKREKKPISFEVWMMCTTIHDHHH